MYVLGISARKVEEVAGALGVSSMSKSQVSRLCESLDSEVAAFRRQRFDGVRFAYLWLDAAPPNPEGAVEKVLLAGQDVGERAQRLGRVCRGVDVDVDAAAVVGESSLHARCTRRTRLLAIQSAAPSAFPKCALRSSKRRSPFPFARLRKGKGRVAC